MFHLAKDFHQNPERLGGEEVLAYFEAFFEQFEIPGYPSLGDSVPPESLTHPEVTVAIVEITHKEQIGGFDYFVFSGPSYSWPPLPTFFWAGQKVRLSEDGILHLHRNGTDIPLYDFSMPSERGHYYEATPASATPVSAFGYISWSEVIEMERWLANQLSFPVFPDHLEVEKNPRYQDQFLEVHFRFSNAVFYSALSDWRVLFVNGYGLGLFERTEEAGHWYYPYVNRLYPISAVLSGNEVLFEKAAEELVLLIEPEFPSIVGQRDKLHIGMGFDFSEGDSGSYRERDDVMLDQRSDGHGGTDGPPFLESFVNQVDLGKVDFDLLASEGPPADLQPAPDSRFARPQEGNTYAFWTQEGGVALVHVLDIVTSRWWGGVRYILFDWIYYPPSEKDTSIKSTSWGEVKKTMRKE